MPITIGIPFFNAEKYLADAIRSVFAQSFQEWELLLVDDGSTDGSLKIAKSVRDPRVRVISDGENRKLAYRLNQITAESKHQVIARMDADDLMSSQRLALQMSVLEEHPDIDLVTAGVCSITDDRTPVGLRCCSEPLKITGRGLLLGKCCIVHAALIGRKSWFSRNPYSMSHPLVEDYELWLRAYSKSDFRIQAVLMPLYYYREEGNVKVSKLLTAYRNQRKLISVYGRLGYSRTGQYKAASRFLGKSLLVRVMAAAGRTDLLLRRRNAPLDRIAAERFQAEMLLIMQTPVPGLN